MKHVILNRLNRYLEEKYYYPMSMVGYRSKLSTMDALRQVKEQMIDSKSKKQKCRAILALDLAGAFDNITHDFILDSISALNLGEKLHKFAGSFLSNREATLKVGELTTDCINLGNKGTPQGSVNSPFLFNISMIGLARELEQVEGISFSIYADDITIWTEQDSEEDVRKALQTAIIATERYLKPSGLKCPRLVSLADLEAALFSAF